MTPDSALKMVALHPGQEASARKAFLFIAGRGSVGSTLLQQIDRLKHPLYELSVIGVCNSHRVLWQSQETDYRFTSDEMSQGNPKNWQKIIHRLKRNRKGPVIFVDTTGSEEVARLYLDLLKNGIHIVTPSKLANTGDQSYFDALQHTAHKKGVQYLYETTVGAGLPVINSIKDILDTGDEIIEISGVVSGTMTYLFDQLENGQSFSSAIVNARSLGYAEPDPRDDLSGEDVARKFLILARTCGLHIERKDVSVESLIPPALAQVDSTTYLQKVSDYDAFWEGRIKREHEKGHTLRYTGLLKDGNIRVGIQSVDRKSPIGQLTGTNNLFLIRTGRYFDQPLIIQGPGAGKEVTAAGVLSDILKVTSQG